ncbi:NAD-dependent succinate-semialdehyde dehydrogenase [Balneolales bacterium ANBcel1]|nr:NAD-dependent succinate-semialdehyde dehydrogenase [Balneolales bacterium ANBcel1]
MSSRIEVTNPASGKTVRTFDTISKEEMWRVVDKSHDTFLEWRNTSFEHRSGLMKKAAALLRERADRYGRIITGEMGKTLASARGEVEKCAWVCDYYADNAREFLSEEPVESDASESFITYNPLGPVLAVMPWNFPFWQVFRFAAPALMAGNTGLLKHASNVPGSALAIEEVFRDAGFPEHAFRTLLIKTSLVEELLESDKVKAATLTGSGPAGSAVASKAGEMLKKTVLELGGSDPYIVLEDADIDAAAATCATSRLINGGQSCIAAKRFIVVEEVLDAFTEKFVEHMRDAVMDDPMRENVTIGPMAREDLRDELHEQVERSVSQGARLVLGGKVPDRPGAWYPPTVLTGVTPGMTAFDEELFGPVAAIISAKDEADAIRLANNSVFGLGAAVFTADTRRGRRIAAEELEAGCCFVNEFVKSDPRLPFGGIKTSGYGRELSHLGILEFTNIKTVYVK